MNNPSPGAVGPSRTHPAIIVAAIAVTIVAAVGAAALTGYLPMAKSFTNPLNTASPAQQQGTVPPDSMVQATAPAAPQPEPAKIDPPKAPEPAPIEAPKAAAAPQPMPPAAPAPRAASAKPSLAVAQPPPPSPPASYGSSRPSAPNYSDPAPRNYSDPAPRNVVAANAPAPLPPPAPKICRNCGTVSEITPIEKQGEGSGVGAVLGGVVGGVLGHQVGSGRGRDVATVAGALGGAYVGNQVEKNKNTVVAWEVRVRLEDGTNQVMRYTTQPAFRVGDRVRVMDGQLLARN